MDSDHVTLMLKMNLNVLPHKPQKVEMLDFKNEMSQIIFKKKATETKDFTDCFTNMSPLLDNCERWSDTLKAYCKKSYPIIRIRNHNIKTSSADNLIDARNRLKKQIDDGKSNDIDDLHRLEEKIAEIIGEEETNKAKLFKDYCNESNSINMAEMWKLKQRIWPKRQETLPAGKFNNQGQIVTDAEELKLFI